MMMNILRKHFLGTPISRLAQLKSPIGRLAFPGVGGIAVVIFRILTERVGCRDAVDDGEEKLLSWTSWEDAINREMEWYLNCPSGRTAGVV